MGQTDGEIQLREAAHVLEYPYRRSVGPVLGASSRSPRAPGRRPHSRRPRAGAARRVRPRDRRGVDRVRGGRPGRRRDDVGVGRRAAQASARRPFAWALVRLDGATRRCSTRSTPGARRRCGRACACARAGTPAPEGNIHDIALLRAGGAHERAGHQHHDPDPPRVHVHGRSGDAAFSARDGRRAGSRPALPRVHKVYVPPRGACPKCGVPTTDEVEVTGKGTVTTFCIVRIPSDVLSVPPPFTCAHVLLDGADIAVLRARPGVPLRPRCAWACGSRRCGRRRKSSRRRFESIRCFRPLDEPDAPFERYKEHLHIDARRRRRRLRAVAQRAPRDLARNEVEMLMPVIAEAKRQAGLTGQRHRLHGVGQLRLPRGPALRVRERARRGRRVAADRRVARRDGRRVGALRGVGEAPARRRRLGARLRVRASRRWATSPTC